MTLFHLAAGPEVKLKIFKRRRKKRIRVEEHADRQLQVRLHPFITGTRATENYLMIIKRTFVFSG